MITGGNLNIIQSIIPAVAGLTPFATRDDALRIGLLTLSKMQIGSDFPSVSVDELKLLGSFSASGIQQEPLVLVRAGLMRWSGQTRRQLRPLPFISYDYSSETFKWQIVRIDHLNSQGNVDTILL